MKLSISLCLVLVFPALATATENHVSITTDSEHRYITSNGIPDHTTEHFPNSRNPNTIQVQKHQFRVPLHPKKADSPTYITMGKIGVALNGIPFHSGIASFWDNDPSSGWQYEALTGFVDLGMDRHNAYVQPNGAYHYYGIPSALIKHSDNMQLIGYAADGFPIYGPNGYLEPYSPSSGLVLLRPSYQVKSGVRPSGPGSSYDGRFAQDYIYISGLGDLDQCNGREGVTPEYPSGTYYYVVTTSFPFIPRCLMGTPDPSFMQKEGQNDTVIYRKGRQFRPALQPHHLGDYLASKSEKDIVQK